MTGADAVTTRWIRRFHSAPPGARRLVCFPYAGGSASYFFPFSASGPPDIQVLAVQYPGRQDRSSEPLVENIADLADQVAEALGEPDDEPVAFFGHSMGAVVAFEVALRWERDQGRTPVHLFLSARRAHSRVVPEDVHRRSDDEIVAELATLDGASADLLADEELREFALPPIRSDYKAIETYHYEPGQRVRCPVTALVGDRDPRVGVDDARAWAQYTSGPFALEVFPGGHFYLTDHQDRALDVVRRALA